jgi:purine/pyrimidine-nucleoside phosphorylase
VTNFENVTLEGVGNVYFDGKCVSHTFHTADGSRKTAGVLLPSKLTFGTDAPEIMDILTGSATVTLDGVTSTYAAGESFSVPGNSSFDIEVTEPTSYICSFG